MNALSVEGRRLFDAAFDVPSDQRRGLLASLCTNQSLCDDVLALLEEHDRLPSDVILRPDLDVLLPAALGAALARRPTAAESQVGTVVRDRYYLTCELGRGGTSIVYLAEDRALGGRRCVVKILQPEAFEEALLLNQFVSEVQKLGHLEDCEGTIVAYDTGRLPDQRPFFVMHYVEGRTLESLIEATDPLPRFFIAAIAERLGAALARAHARGVLHLDVKPSNVIVDVTGTDVRLWLIDFGASKVISAQTSRSTTVSRIVGTVGYMASERFTGGECPATDVYSLAIVVFEMMAKRRPTKDEIAELEAYRKHGEATDLGLALPTRFFRTLATGLAYDPADRGADAAAFGAALARSLSSLPWIGSVFDAIADWYRRFRVHPRALLEHAAAIALVGFVGISIWESIVKPHFALNGPVQGGIGDAVDAFRQVYLVRDQVLTGSFLPHFVVAFIALGLVLQAGGSLRVRARSAPMTVACFAAPVLLLFSWLTFGFAIDDLIKWRAQAWAILVQSGDTSRASGFNDGGYIDGWFMLFRPTEHAIDPTYRAPNMVFFVLFNGCLFTLNHACTFALLWVGGQRVMLARSNLRRSLRAVLHALPWAASTLLVLSHLQFRYGGHNPNWFQPLVGAASVVLAVALCRHARRQRAPLSEAPDYALA